MSIPEPKSIEVSPIVGVKQEEAVSRPNTVTPEPPSVKQEASEAAAGSSSGVNMEDKAIKTPGENDRATPESPTRAKGPDKMQSPKSEKKKKKKAMADAEVASKHQEEPRELATGGEEVLDGNAQEEVNKGPNTELILQVFGFDVLHQLEGKVWDERAQAVQTVRARVAQIDVGDSTFEDFFQASCSMAQISLGDKVMPVYLDGLELAKLLLGDFCQSQPSPELVQEGVHKLVPIIVAKSSDRNARSIEGTQAALVFLARQPLVGCQPVMTHMLLPIASAKEVAAIRGRLELISQFISEFGFSKSSGMSLSAVMGFVRPHLDATDEKVRRAAVEVTVQCYQLKGERTRKFCANLKPALQKLLEQRFVELDGGKPAGKPASAGGKLPALRGMRGRPQGANLSRGSSRNSSSAGSVCSSSFGKQIGMPMPPATDGIVGTPKNALSLSIQENVISDPFMDSTAPCEMENPNFIPSPTGAKNDLFSNEEEDFLKEMEGF